MATWRDLGFDNFMTRTIPSGRTFSPLEAKNAIPTGGISASKLVSPLNATTNIVFSSTDNNTAAWASGTIYFADGTNSGTIDAGNTGDIAATTYVYYDKEKLGILQTTTTVANATGTNKLLIAIVESGASGKDCKITPTIAAGLNVSGITADQITAGTVTADEIAAATITTAEIAANTIEAGDIKAGTITGTEISGTQLDVVAANTGTLDVDEYITLGSDANVKLDGANKRILISDGTDNRILIGYQLNGF